MSDLMSIDTARALELRQRMEQAADDLDWDAQALAGPLSEASTLLGGPVPDAATGARRLAGELRSSAADLEERTRIVMAGGLEMNEGLAALERIRDNFTLVESRGEPARADGLLSRRDLQWAKHSADDDTAEAATWLLEHNRFFDQVETAKHNDDYLDRPHRGEFAFDASDRDGLMSLDDIDAFLEKTEAWSRLLPHMATIDNMDGEGRPDDFLSRHDFETFLADYNLSPEVSAAVRKVLDDGAFHKHEGGSRMGLLLDAVSFVPVIGDVVDGARSIYYVLHGDYATASLFALGLVPLPGLSSSGIRGAVKVVESVADVARKSGTKAAFKEAVQRGVKGTGANYAAYESTRQAQGLLTGRPELDDSVDYVIDDVLGPKLEDSLGQKIDPRLRKVMSDRLETSLRDKLDSDSVQWLSDANQRIARRIAEHHAHDMNFRRPRFRPK